MCSVLTTWVCPRKDVYSGVYITIHSSTTLLHIHRLFWNGYFTIPKHVVLTSTPWINHVIRYVNSLFKLHTPLSSFMPTFSIKPSNPVVGSWNNAIESVLLWNNEILLDLIELFNAWVTEPVCDNWPKQTWRCSQLCCHGIQRNNSVYIIM